MAVIRSIGHDEGGAQVATGTTARRGIDALANVLRIIGMAIVLVLVVFIVLTLLDANPDNGLTTIVRDLANTFDLGLSDLFQPEEPKLGVVLNYGTAALIWFAITTVVVRLVRRAA
jgi:amino acid transporter